MSGGILWESVTGGGETYFDFIFIPYWLLLGFILNGAVCMKLLRDAESNGVKGYLRRENVKWQWKQSLSVSVQYDSTCLEGLRKVTNMLLNIVNSWTQIKIAIFRRSRYDLVCYLITVWLLFINYLQLIWYRCMILTVKPALLSYPGSSGVDYQLWLMFSWYSSNYLHRS
jgi:hypothetical protein